MSDINIAFNMITSDFYDKNINENFKFNENLKLSKENEIKKFEKKNEKMKKMKKYKMKQHERIIVNNDIDLQKYINDIANSSCKHNYEIFEAYRDGGSVDVYCTKCKYYKFIHFKLRKYEEQYFTLINKIDYNRL